MVITPNNEVVLLSVPIEIDYKNQLTFQNSNKQFEYFRFQPNSRVYDKITYVRKDSYIIVNDCFDNLIKYNYCMYQNENFSNKWYYCFIIKMEYLSHNSTKIYIKTDVFQTYQFDVTYKQSFVEREHINVNEDEIGANQVPENLEIGEVIENSSATVKGLGICYVIAYSRNPSDVGGQTSQNGCIVNGIASGLWYYICNSTNLLRKLSEINEKGYGDDVKAVYAIPTIAIYGFDSAYSLDELDNPNQVWGFWVINQFYSNGATFELKTPQGGGVPSSLNGYTPRNQKLRQYPFQYLGFTPSNGTSKIFRYEDFENGIPNFKLISEINPNPSVYFVPRNFKGIYNENVSESVVINGYPAISYKTDFFSNWLAQNSQILDLNLEQNQFNYDMGLLNNLSNATNTVGNILSGNIGGAVSSGIDTVSNQLQNVFNYDMTIKQQMAQVEKQSLLPNSGNVGGSNATLLGYGLMNQDIFTRYSIKAQFAERIDQFFDMFGYQTNKLKVPNITGRPNWNYVKTSNLNIVGKNSSNIPQEDMQEYKNIFNNGITLWHNSNTFLDYSQNNR